MNRAFKLFVLLVIMSGASIAAMSSYAATPAYRFEIVDQTVHAGQGVTVSVHLSQSSTGKTVTNATITGQKLLMMMGKMEPMPAPVKPLPPDANGNYRFACDVIEPGDWELDLSANIPNGQEPVHDTLKFKVVK